MKRATVVLLALAGCATAWCQQLPDPTAYRKGLEANPTVRTAKGELFTWHAAYGIDGLDLAYRASRDTRWLDESVAYFAFLIGKMDTDPDGYKGWIGPHLAESDYHAPAVVGDANLFAPMLKFAELVLKDPALKEKYGTRAAEYVALVKKDLIEKYDAWGSYVENGPYAAYAVQSKFIDPKKPGQWVVDEDLRVTENLNKSGKMGTCYLRLYRITGDESYRKRAEKLFGHYKLIMRYLKDEDRYIWNFWEPFGPWDMTSVPRLWVGVHPERAGYQAAEVGYFVEAYHTGVVFDETDVKRIINTNLWMWNKSLENPSFKSSDGSTNAGTLWAALEDFDPTIRKLHLAALAKDSSSQGVIRRAYAEQVTAKESPSFKRTYVRDGERVSLPVIPLQPSRDISMAVAVPMTFKAGDRVRVCCQVRTTGRLKVVLLAKDGREIATLQDVAEAKPQYVSQRWYGLDAAGKPYPPGEYRIRWTMNDSVRETPVFVKPGR